MRRIVVWKRLDVLGVEYSEIDLEPLRLAGELVFVEDGAACAVSYRVTCRDDGTTEEAVVRSKCDGEHRECALVRTPSGSWTMNGLPVPLPDGVSDVDLSVTPATNTLPLRRLRLQVGQQADVTAAWVKFPSLAVECLRQRYRRTSASTYLYEAVDLDFRAELECDPEGIVSTYGALWERCF